MTFQVRRLGVVKKIGDSVESTMNKGIRRNVIFCIGKWLIIFFWNNPSF